MNASPTNLVRVAEGHLLWVVDSEGDYITGTLIESTKTGAFIRTKAGKVVGAAWPDCYARLGEGGAPLMESDEETEDAAVR